jgi:hypothetical protein
VSQGARAVTLSFQVRTFSSFLLLEFHNTSLLMLLIFVIILSGVRLSPLGTAATAGLLVLYQPQMIDDGDCGAIGG